MQLISFDEFIKKDDDNQHDLSAAMSGGDKSGKGKAANKGKDNPLYR